jgi:hypothetical protein
MYLPTLKSARTVKMFRLGSYLAVVMTDCESSGVIQYTHVVFAGKLTDQQPTFAVAAEVNRRPFPGCSHFLGVFPGSGHRNLGCADTWADLDAFTSKALAIIAEHFAIGEPPQELPPPGMN